MPRQDTQGPTRPGPPPTAVCVGESMAVLLPDRPGPLESVESFRLSVGGAESNVAGALAAHGVPTAWISRVGDDGFGRRLLAEVAARGVDVSAVAVDPHRPTGLYLKEVGGSTGDHHDLGPGRSRLHYHRRGSAAAALSPICSPTRPPPPCWPAPGCSTCPGSPPRSPTTASPCCAPCSPTAARTAWSASTSTGAPRSGASATRPCCRRC